MCDTLLARILEHVTHPTESGVLGQAGDLVAGRPRNAHAIARRTPFDRAMVVLWASYVATNAIDLVVWVSLWIGDGRPDDFWPLWFAGPVGVALLCLETIRRVQRRDRPSGSTPAAERCRNAASHGESSLFMDCSP